MDQSIIFTANKVSKWYQMGEVRVEALKEASFEVYKGEFIVVLGPSGSGKSTMLNVIGGMDKVSGGELHYHGSPLHKASERMLTKYRREAVGFVFQHYNLMSNLTALENVNLSVEISRNPLSAMEVLKDVGLAERADHFPSQLSGGEQQRVAIARAIAKNPEILLCDEPTGALDYKTGIHVLRLLRKFNVEYQKTVMVITHNASIADMADRVFTMKDGKLADIRVNQNPVAPEEVSW
ncbi:macrolide ABC transporter ATP-binding protein [Desulfuribacillus stibiiarsenatis]|uniref:Macrolide ABC transporter ATP-binding protein n=1 Tax=Desulfuribacillus stibiiarsenatis TaxID=1390249 RepID=A0A1E5L4M3_9FIRM|nr:ABC transporter ATP-binding protein [Desulfuribacillus stibiiarsenatis]OEH84919.1 macrolide ABC transporter ATP-binding protein [Desulfuribacillus stibiiarsenatis]